MRFVALLALILGACSGCNKPPAPSPVTPTPPQPVATYDCASDCRRASPDGGLGCDWAAPTDKGASCVDVCMNAQSFGDKWNHACRSTAMSCQAVDGCQ